MFHFKDPDLCLQAGCMAHPATHCNVSWSSMPSTHATHKTSCMRVIEHHSHYCSYSAHRPALLPLLLSANIMQHCVHVCSSREDQTKCALFLSTSNWGDLNSELVLPEEHTCTQCCIMFVLQLRFKCTLCISIIVFSAV